jgi:hypothetical protein
MIFRGRAFLALAAVALVLTGCAPAHAEQDPPSSSGQSETTTPPAADTIEPPTSRVPVACDALVPNAGELGFTPGPSRAVVDIDSARLVQGGITECLWSSADNRVLSVTLFPDFPEGIAGAQARCQWYSGSGMWSCHGDTLVGSVVLSIGADPGAVAVDQGSADSWFTAIEATASAAITAAGVLPPWAGPTATLPPDVFASLDDATVADIFGVPSSGVPSAPQERLGAAGVTLTHSSGYIWGEVAGARWATAELLPAGAWALDEFSTSEPAPWQMKHDFEPVSIDGLDRTVVDTSAGSSQACGAIGDDLLCVTSVETDPGAFATSVEEFVALLGGVRR